MDAAGGWKKLSRGADQKLNKVVTPNPQSGPDLRRRTGTAPKGKLMGVTMPRLDGNAETGVPYSARHDSEVRSNKRKVE